MSPEEQLQAIEDEWYVVRYSGETPEIAYNSAIYYLTRAKDGPLAVLSEQQVELLRQAAVDRFSEIVLRDLLHENSCKAIYRGVERSRVNYQRFCKFCFRQQLGVEKIQQQAAKALLVFLDQEWHFLQKADRQTIINCSFQDLSDYAGHLGVELTARHHSLAKHCQCSSG